ncbi:MAG: hypothetical protein RL637_838 [Pseudomonadota bacterium]|jgi:DNA adenine methylase
MIKSPLRYPGGKTRAAEFISQLMPDFKEFREPFLGGGSVFCYVKQKFPNRIYWLNDIYFELINFWQISQTQLPDLLQKIQQWKNQYPIGRELYQFLNQNCAQFNAIEMAAAFFIYNRITFSGTTLSGGYSEAAFIGRFTASSLNRLSVLPPILQNVLITQLDYQALLTAKGEQVFIFLDPPYYSATKSALYGKKGELHKLFDHQRFAAEIKQCPHQWLITYDDSDYIRNLFKDFNIVAWDLTYGMRNVAKSSNQIGKELLISNYTLFN